MKKLFFRIVIDEINISADLSNEEEKKRELVTRLSAFPFSSSFSFATTFVARHTISVLLLSVINFH